MTEPSPKLDLVLAEAGDPSTSSNRLHALVRSRRREVRETVAGNPNALVADIDVLCRHFSDAVSANAVLDWFTLTDADWLNELSEESRHRLLATRTCPPGLLWWAAQHGDDDDLRAVLANPSCPAEVVRRAMVHEDPSIVEAASLHIAVAAIAAVADVNEDTTEDTNEDDEETVGLAFARVVEESELGDLLAAGFIPRKLIELLDVPSDGDARREFARRPDTPAAMLRALLSDDDAITRRYARRNPSTPDVDRQRWDRLHAGVDLDTEDLAVLAVGTFGLERCAAYPRLAPETLRSCVLDASWRVREAAASNPSLTLAHVAVLANDPDRDVRAAAAKNAVLPIAAVLALTIDVDGRVRDAATKRLEVSLDPSVVVDAGLLRSLNQSDALTRLLRRGAALKADLGTLTATELAVAIADDDAALRLALAANASAPATILAELSRDADPGVRRLVAGTTCDPELLAALASDVNGDVQAATAANAHLPIWVALRLAELINEDVRSALLVRPDLTPGLVDRLFTNDPDPEAAEMLCAHTVAGGSRVDLDEKVLERIVGVSERHPWVALVVAQLPATPPALLVAFRSSSNWRVRQAVAAHRSTPLEVLQALASDADNDVRSAVASNPGVRPEDLAVFFAETDEKVRRALVARDDITPELLAVHVLGDDGIRDLALAHPRLDPATRRELSALREGRPVAADTLSRFVSSSARALVVAHPDATAELLNIAVNDVSWTIREAVAEHPNCSSADLTALADDQDRDVRTAVAASAGTDPEVLARLANDPDARVRRAATANPAAFPAMAGQVANVRNRMLAASLRSPRPVVRAVALLRDEVPGEVLNRARHRTSIDWIERFAVAQHPNTSTEIRQVLASDANRLVAAAANGVIRWG